LQEHKRNVLLATKLYIQLRRYAFLFSTLSSPFITAFYSLTKGIPDAFLNHYMAYKTFCSQDIARGSLVDVPAA
jgi:hypothetical protein